MFRHIRSHCCRWLLLAGVLGAGQSWAAPVTLPGASQFVLTSRFTGQQYVIYLSVPDVPAPAGGYPVLYALDGDAAFAVLHLNNPRQPAALAALAQHSLPAPLPGVVVGIGYGKPFLQTMRERSRDYLPDTAQGGAAAFSRFLTEELQATIAARLPVNPARQSLLGHSYGGLFTLYQLRHNPAAFHCYFAISPSLWQSGWPLTDWPATATPPALLALWVGGAETPQADDRRLPAYLARLRQNRMVDNARELAHTLALRLPAMTLDLRVVPGHDHGEMAAYAYARVLDLAFAPDGGATHCGQ